MAVRKAETGQPEPRPDQVGTLFREGGDLSCDRWGWEVGQDGAGVRTSGLAQREGPRQEHLVWRGDSQSQVGVVQGGVGVKGDRGAAPRRSF